MACCPECGRSRTPRGTSSSEGPELIKQIRKKLKISHRQWRTMWERSWKRMCVCPHLYGPKVLGQLLRVRRPQQHWANAFIPETPGWTEETQTAVLTTSTSRPTAPYHGFQGAFFFRFDLIFSWFAPSAQFNILLQNRIVYCNSVAFKFVINVFYLPFNRYIYLFLASLDSDDGRTFSLFFVTTNVFTLFIRRSTMWSMWVVSPHPQPAEAECSPASPLGGPAPSAWPAACGRPRWQSSPSATGTTAQSGTQREREGLQFPHKQPSHQNHPSSRPTFMEAREESGMPFSYFPVMMPHASGDHVMAPTPVTGEGEADRETGWVSGVTSRP